jgi:cell fate regulator YaaT (PSP1 superfamily)
MNNENENIKFDCSRGCTVTRGQNDELNCTYRRGCCKLEAYDWLHGVGQEQYAPYFEVRFKNTRKGIYRNDSGQSVKMGDMVIVEAQSGHDLGIVTLEGPVVGRQMKCKGIDPATYEFKRIYRKAKPFDIEKWQDAIAREQDTMIRARQIAAELGLEMKIGDVEFQGDGTKAIFYYIADGRVDFRQLIKVFAEEFRIRIEMKQIGARQEAGLIGGLGVCGRELCCANYITNFKSITTGAARVQDLSLNPQKLAGQCGKLKCCLNYEVANYMDAQSRIPRVSEPLEFEDGQAWLVKTDILREIMYFSYEKGSLANTYALDASEVREIIKMNRNGIRPESLKFEPEPELPEFVTAVGDDSISRFDNVGKKRKKKGGSGKKGENRQGGQQNRRPSKPKEGGQQPS